MLSSGQAAVGTRLGSWLANEADRKRFKQTTAAYGRTTGVF